MKHIDGAQPQFRNHRVNLFSNRIQSYESKLISEFESVQQRINLLKAQTMGRFYAIRFVVRQYSSR